jgi:hypothetical protein
MIEIVKHRLPGMVVTTVLVNKISTKGKPITLARTFTKHV